MKRSSIWSWGFHHMYNVEHLSSCWFTHYFKMRLEKWDGLGAVWNKSYTVGWSWPYGSSHWLPSLQAYAYRSMKTLELRCEVGCMQSSLPLQIFSSISGHWYWTGSYSGSIMGASIKTTPERMDTGRQFHCSTRTYCCYVSLQVLAWLWQYIN